MMTKSSGGILATLAQLWSGPREPDEAFYGPPPLYRLAVLWLLSAAQKGASAVIIGDPPDAPERLGEPATQRLIDDEARAKAAVKRDIAELGLALSEEDSPAPPDEISEDFDPADCGPLRGETSTLRVWLRIDGRHEYLCGFPPHLFAGLIAVLDEHPLVGDFGHGHARLTAAGGIELGLCADPCVNEDDSQRRQPRPGASS